MVEKREYLKQCCSCEIVFFETRKDDTCPNCGSGYWVYGYIDEPISFLRKYQLTDDELETLYQGE